MSTPAAEDAAVLHHLQAVWVDHVADIYRAGRISSVAGLQAEFYCQLRQHCPDLDVFVAPGMLYGNGTTPGAKPDLVVCTGDKIRLVAEIRFLPHWHASHRGAISKLQRLRDAGMERPHPLCIDPATGKLTDGGHRMTDATRFALLVIGRGNSAAVRRDALQPLLSPASFAERFVLFYGRIVPEIEFGVDGV